MVNKKEYTKAQAARFSGENLAARNRLKSAYRFFEVFVDKNLPLLDIGTRDGWMLDYLKRKKFINITGVDITVDAVKHAQKEGRNVIWADMHDLSSFDKEGFGTILMIHSFEHCYDSKVVVDGVHRILKPNGILYVEVPLETHAAKDVAHFCNFTSIHDVLKTLGPQFKLLKHKVVPLSKKLKNMLCVFRKI